MTQQFDDETLMAFADGELDQTISDQIEAALKTDDALMVRLAEFMQTRTASSAALAPLLDAPVPDSLLRSVTKAIDEHEALSKSAENVVSFKPKNATQKPPIYRFEMAAAACIALVVGGFAGFFASDTRQNSTETITAFSLAQSDIVKAIESVPSGQEVDLPMHGRFRAIASFEDSSKTLCREIELDRLDQSTLVAVICNEDDGWQTRFTVAATSLENGYAPASSLEALDAYLIAVGAGEPMTIEEENRALKR